MKSARRAALIATAASLFTSCGAPHPGFSNGSVSACYRALPAARTAVHDKHATVVGVHRVGADTVRDWLPVGAKAQLAADNDTVVCVITFRGTFGAGQVDLAPPAESGRFAVVLVSSRHLRLVASVVLPSEPHHLGKRTL